MADLHKTGILATLVLSVLLLVVGCVQADTSAAAAASPPQKLVNLQVTGAPIIDVIDSLFSQAGYKYTIEPGVSGDITLKLKGVSFDSALQSIADGANLTYKLSGNRYVISPRPKTRVVLRPGSGNYLSGGQTDETTSSDDSSPVFYGSSEAAPYGPVSIGVDGGSVVFLPNGESVVVLGEQTRIRPRRAVDSPFFNTVPWQRLKAGLGVWQPFMF